MGNLKKVTGLLKSTVVFATITILSRITGLIRELIFAYFFGAGASLDAFWVAYRIPNFLRRLFAEGALSQAFIPVLSEYRLLHSEQETQTFINQLFTWLSLGVVILTCLAILTSSYLVNFFAFGFSLQNKLLTVKLLRLIFPFLIFVTLAAFYSGILNSHRHFWVSAFAPVCFNIVLILFAIIAGKQGNDSIYLLAVGVSIAGLIQWLIQVPVVQKLRKVPTFVFVFPSATVKKVFRLMLPAIFGVSVNQVNFLVNTCLASFMTVGSLSWLNYADRLASVPLGVIGVAVTSVILPQLSCEVSEQNQDQFIKTMDWGLTVLMLIALPAALGLILLGKPIIATLFYRGAFNLKDLHQTYLALIGYAIGIPFFMQVKILATGFYAHQNLKVPTVIGFISVLTNLVLAVFLFPLGHLGLAIASSFASIVNVLGLYFSLKKRRWYNLNTFRGKLNQLLLAQGLMFVFLFKVQNSFPFWIQWSGLHRLLMLLGVLLVSLILYFIGLLLSRFKWRELLR